MNVSCDQADGGGPRHRGLPVVTDLPGEAPGGEIPSLCLVEPALRRVRDLMNQSLAARRAERELAPLFEHLKSRSGKMLRPALVLLAAECFGPLTEQHIRSAAVMEMIHHATLFHDDVIDDGSKRRGEPTANRLWGNESAVLLGDFVLSCVFHMVADLDPAAVAVVAQTAVRVCEGELRQVMQRQNWRLTEDEYLDIITEKSASFFSGCCRLGALLARARPDQVEALAAFGLHAGIAFQITDDLLDITGDESVTGKTTRSDFAQDKLTLAVIHLLRVVDAAGRTDVCAMLETPGKARDRLVEMLVRHGSLAYAREQAARYVTRAAEALASLPASRAKDALLETAHFMTRRTA